MQIQQTLYSELLIVYSNIEYLFEYLQLGDTINFTVSHKQQQMCIHLKEKLYRVDIMFFGQMQKLEIK